MDFELIQQIAGLLMAVIGAIGLVPLVNWVKVHFVISGGRAQLLAAVIATIVAVLSLVVSGELTPEVVTSEGFVAVLLLVWTVSQQVYKRISAG